MLMIKDIVKDTAMKAYLSYFGTYEEYYNLKWYEKIPRFLADIGISYFLLSNAHENVKNDFNAAKNIGFIVLSSWFLTDLIFASSGRPNFLSDVRHKRKENNFRSNFKLSYLDDEHTSGTLGSQQLLYATYLKLKDNSLNENEIKTSLTDIDNKLLALENMLKNKSNVPTFGCEFFIERRAIDSLSRKYDINKSVDLINQLLNFSQETKIRNCTYLGDDTIEFRINPSYAPIVIAETKSLFDLGILPKDILIGYSVNMVGEDVLDYALPLLLINLAQGLTPKAETSEGELSFKDVHVYHGATVDIFTGDFLPGTPQLNIFSGITAYVENNKELLPLKDLLENDVKNRLNRMFLPFLLNQKERDYWAKKVINIFGLSYKNIINLNQKIMNAESVNKVWKTDNDIKVFESSEIKNEIDNLYAGLEQKLMEESPELYETLNFELK